MMIMIMSVVMMMLRETIVDVMIMINYGGIVLRILIFQTMIIVVCFSGFE